MGCACENKKRMADIAKMRSLARKAAKMEGKVYILKSATIIQYTIKGRFMNR